MLKPLFKTINIRALINTTTKKKIKKKQVSKQTKNLNYNWTIMHCWTITD